MDDVKTEEGNAFELMKQALTELRSVKSKTRENSLAATKLEEAVMWNNKDRAIKGELEKSETFV